jgi:hypothetical protein
MGVQASELRLGNLISDDDGCMAKINGFTPFDHSVRCDEAEGCILLIDVYHELTDKWKMGREADSPECKPIPLTPEWLERCGFEYLPFSTDISMFSFYKKSETFELIIVNDGINCEYKHGVFYYEDEHHPVVHVHQLQNLYFALTGEELQIKMP